MDKLFDKFGSLEENALVHYIVALHCDNLGKVEGGKTMLNDISSIKLQGANFSSATNLLIFDSSDGKQVKLSLIYGRNGSGKSTIAKAFRHISGEAVPTIFESVPLNMNNDSVTLTEAEGTAIFVFDEDFVDANVRIEDSGLGSIVMLGEQADLSGKIKTATAELADAEEIVKAKTTILEEYKTSTNLKAPRYYIEKMKNLLSSGTSCWAEREKLAKGNLRKPSVSDDTYKRFIAISPEKNRDELVVLFEKKMKELDAAKSGTTIISEKVSSISGAYKKYNISFANEMIKKKLEKPELTERDRYLLSLITAGKSEELQERIDHLNNRETSYCPYCLQDLKPEYKYSLSERIEKLLADEVNQHQVQLKALKMTEFVMDLEMYSGLPSYAKCFDQIIVVNNTIEKNNGLLQRKIENPYSPVTEEVLVEISESIELLEENLTKLEEERITHNKAAEKTQPIIDELLSINNQIAHYDIFDLSVQLESQKLEMEKANKAYNDAVANRDKKKELLDELDARRKRVDIAIDIINNGLKYIFFAENRLSIECDGDFYKLLSNGQPVKPKNVSVGERNVIGLCYFFTSILKGKNKDNAYNDEYLIVIDDPVSSYDFENKVGILSFLKYKLGQFLKGNLNTRAIIMTHDLLTMFELEKVSKELNSECSFPGVKTTYMLNELKNCELEQFKYKDRQEYTELVKLIYEYGRGKATEYDIVIGNIMRQALEAFATFEYKKGIEEISTNDSILAASGMCEEHRTYFKNLMYRIVLNGGSHRKNQTRSLELDFLAVISEAEKRRTAQEILCFIYLLNRQHLLAHLGNVARTLDDWCEVIKARSATP